jgi:hypothetical protein
MNGVVGDEYCHSHSPELRHHCRIQRTQDSDGHFFGEFVDFIRERGEQELLPLMQAIASTRNLTEARNMLGTSARSINHMHRRLRVLGQCFVSGEPVPHQRKLYKERNT